MVCLARSHSHDPGLVGDHFRNTNYSLPAGCMFGEDLRLLLYYLKPRDV
jgi:hypothetical protein